LRKENGFRSYFEKNGLTNPIIKIDIRKTDNRSIEKTIAATFNTDPDIQAIFVTNSRVASVAQYLENSGRRNIFMVGYDYLDDNIGYLKKGFINFLICHKPQEQGYKGVLNLYQSIVLNAKIENEYFMPIDIISKENFSLYRN
jgi:LacI family transcriptional regulator